MNYTIAPGLPGNELLGFIRNGDCRPCHDLPGKPECAGCRQSPVYVEDNWNGDYETATEQEIRDAETQARAALSPEKNEKTARPNLDTSKPPISPKAGIAETSMPELDTPKPIINPQMITAGVIVTNPKTIECRCPLCEAFNYPSADDESYTCRECGQKDLGTESTRFNPQG